MKDVKTLINNNISSNVHKNIFFKIAENNNDEGKIIDFMIKRYNVFINNRELFRNKNITFESFFPKSKNRYSFENFENFSDSVNKTILRHKAIIILKRILSSKYFYLQDYKTIYILEELVNEGFSAVEVQDFLGKKIILLKNAKDFNDALIELLNGKKTWNKEYLFSLINKNELKLDIDYNIISENDFELYIHIKTFKAAQAIGVKMWCLSRDSEMFDHYNIKSSKNIMFKFDFNRLYSDLSSTIAVLFDRNNIATDIYLKNDELINEKSFIHEHIKIKKGVSHYFPVIENQIMFFENLLKFKNLQQIFLNEKGIIDFTSYRILKILFLETMFPMEKINKEILKPFKTNLSLYIEENKESFSIFDLFLIKQEEQHFDDFYLFQNSNSNSDNAILFFEENKKNEYINSIILKFIIESENYDVLDYLINTYDIKKIIEGLEDNQQVDFIFNLINYENDKKSIFYYSDSLFNMINIDSKNKILKKLGFSDIENKLEIIKHFNKMHNNFNNSILLNIFDNTFEENESIDYLFTNIESYDFYFNEFKLSNKKRIHSFLKSLFFKHNTETEYIENKNHSMFFNEYNIKKHSLFFATVGRGKNSSFNIENANECFKWSNGLFFKIVDKIIEHNKTKDIKDIISNFFHVHPFIIPNAFYYSAYASNKENQEIIINKILLFVDKHSLTIDKNKVLSFIQKEEIEDKKKLKDNYTFELERGVYIREKPNYYFIKKYVKHNL